MLNDPECIATVEVLGLDYNNGGYNISFHDVITRAGLIHRYHLAFSGGSENSNYQVSFGFMDHNAIVKVNDYRDLMVKLDTIQKVFDGRLVDDFGVYGYLLKTCDIFDAQVLFYSAVTQNPTYPAGADASGNWVKNSATSRINHLGVFLYEKNSSEGRNFNIHLGLKLNILDSLILLAFDSYSYSSTGNARFCPTWVWVQDNVYRGELKGEDYFTNVSLSYNNAWEDSHLDAVVGAEYPKQIRIGLWVQVKGITTNDFSYNNVGATSSRPFGGTSSNYEDQSPAPITGSVTCSYEGKYSIAAALRGDGSSMVGDNNTFGFFPSVLLGQDIKEEGFLSDTDFITMLKLRTGCDRSGNLGGITSYTTLNTVKEGGIVSINGAPTATMGGIYNTNPDLKWETHSALNIDFDLSVWGNRLMLISELYYSKTTDILYEYNVPASTFVLDKLMANIDSMSSQGVELGISVVSIQRKDTEMNINFNMSYQGNKLPLLDGECNGMHMTASDITPIGSLYSAGQSGGDNNIVYQIVGQPLGVFYLPHYKGLKGDELSGYSYDIEDLNGDGEIDSSDDGDRYVVGQATPEVTIGSNIGFRYKSSDIAMQINDALGYKISNGTGLAYINTSIFPNYNVLKGAPGKSIIDQNVSDYWLKKGDYINTEYTTIGCNVPVKFKAMKSLCLSAGISNLATTTGYSGLIPIINNCIVSNTSSIDDKHTYPLCRTHSLGLSIQF